MKLRNILAALALTSGPALAQDDMVLLLDWFVNPDHGPIILAQEKGYFAEQDLSVEVIAPADPSDPPKLVAAGKADLAISYQPQLHLQIHEGLPLQRVGTLVATPLNCLLALTDGPIASPADLAGKKVGFSVGGVEEAVLGAILTHHGLSLDDVELVNINWSLSPSLMSGQVDAVIGAFRNFELNQMDIEGVDGTCFYVEEEGLPPYDELIYVAEPGHDGQGQDRAVSGRDRESDAIYREPPRRKLGGFRRHLCRSAGRAERPRMERHAAPFRPAPHGDGCWTLRHIRDVLA